MMTAIPWHRTATFVLIGASSTVLLTTGCTSRRDLTDPIAGHPAHADQHGLTVGGQRLRVVMHGDGPAVVFIHGNPGTLDELERYVVPTFAGYRTVTWDRPGYGESGRTSAAVADPAVQAKLLRGLLDKLQIDNPVLVAHSWGCSVALAYAADYPEATDGLVLASPLFDPAGRSSLFQRWPGLADLTVAVVPTFLAETLTVNRLQEAFAPEAMPGDFWATVKPRWLQPAQMRSSLQDSGRLGAALAALQGRYGSLRMPIHVLAGGSDRSADPAVHAIPLERALPNAQLTILPDAGHEFPFTQPGRLRAAADLLREP